MICSAASSSEISGGIANRKALRFTGMYYGLHLEVPNAFSNTRSRDDRNLFSGIFTTLSGGVVSSIPVP